MREVVIAAGLLAAACFLVYFGLRRQRGMWIDPADPLFAAATQKARASVDLLRQLHALHSAEIGIKFPFRTDSGEREHVWGTLLAIGESEFTTRIETPPIAHAGPLPDSLSVPLDELEDWHLTLPDGEIRGSFTTQAEIQIRIRDGDPVPPQLANLAPYFVDRM